jgi:hypothetical protein
LALGELERCGLLEPPAGSLPQLSRREVAAAVAGGALLAPLILSVAVPDSASAASAAVCPAGAVSGGCFIGGPTTNPGTVRQLPGLHGFTTTTNCPVQSGNIYNTNCYVTLSGATVCTGSSCVPGGQGCSPTAEQCCAGGPCCTPILGLPGSYHCSQ